jgi:uncharacterized membrane protein YqiK
MSFYVNLFFLILPLLIAITLVVIFNHNGKPTQVTLMEFQRGLLYKRGFPVRDVGPGRHWVWSGTQLLIHADTRPRSVGYEKMAVALQDGSTAVYGFLASVQMRDVRKAIYSGRNYEHVANAALLRCARLALSQRSSAQLRTGLENLTQEIIADAKSRLAAAGFDLVSFRITDLSVVVPNPNSSTTQPPNATLA